MHSERRLTLVFEYCDQVFINLSLHQGRIQKIQKEGGEETDDAVLHNSGSICDQTLGLTLLVLLKNTGKKGGVAPSPPPPPKSAHVHVPLLILFNKKLIAA